MSNALTLAVPFPSAVGSLDTYIQAVNRAPLLTQEQETEYARRLRDHEDVEAAHQLVVSHLRVVVAIARGYLGYGLPHGDLIQEGNVGLMKAVRRFDPERGVRLVSFAIHWIRAEIHEYILRNWRIVKVATTKAQRKLFFNLRSLKKGHGTLSPSEVDAMARELNVKAEDVVEMETRLGGQDIALEPLSEDEDEAFAPIAYLTNAEDEPAQVLQAQETERNTSEGLTRALDSLDARSRRIIEARWLREDDTATLHELADEFGVSAERIRQIESQAMKKMRGAMAPVMN
ncbi:MAG TPA: RNA polymerase sigma factor RpoH [Burkholderiales bacterium]|jgi:RNA polymerase sigma-32 factor|nr:RNA polymerase sigma factor RpoH [Burkholderiales bacterium]